MELLELFLSIFWYSVLDYQVCSPESTVIECRINQEDMEFFEEIENIFTL